MSHKKIRCLVVDDEPHAIEVLKKYIQSTPSLEFVGECHHALAAFEFPQTNTIDLIFLDIQMPKLSGIEFIRSLPHPPHVIFTTAHREYAVDGFELSAVDYLLKPVSFDRFLKAIYKLTQNNHLIETTGKDISSERFLYFRAERKMIKVMLHEILYVESLKDYVKIVTVKGQIITKQSISSVEEMLPENEFLRIHRSFIIALRKIDSFTSTDITIGKAELPVGPLYRHEIAKKIQVSL